MRECINYKKLDNGAVRCLACSHFCAVKEGETGKCGVRQNRRGIFYSLVYGKAFAANIDPIEKKPLFHFLPGTRTFSFGTLGCNLACANCQNFGISQIFGRKGRAALYAGMDWGRGLSPAEIAKEALRAGCGSIACTYNEPTVFLEYALDAMKAAKRNNLKNIWVSNGFMSSETLESISGCLDAINIDIKSFSEEFYKKNCGGRLKPVLENAKQLVKAGVWTEITTLIIPTLSDSPAMLRQLARFIKRELGSQVPWHISAFSGRISWKLKHLPDTDFSSIRKAYQIGKEEGLKYVYAGNVRDADMESTFCPECGEAAIIRIGYQIERKDQFGRCAHCDAKIGGVFASSQEARNL